MNFSKSHKGFTLVEMLIVIGIIAVLAAVVITVLNPVEFLKKGRDSRRMVDLQTLDKALRLADFDNISMGTANVVYVSIPDDSGGATTTCNLGLPALPGGWTYQCSNTSNYRKADGTGWVPVNFTSLTTAPNPLTLLPVDPTNSTSTNLYYTYVSGSWELTALFETTGYQTKYASTDNGTSTVLLEVGNHLKITPNAIASRSGPVTPIAPTLATNVATNVASTTATLNGSITNEGSSSSTIVGFDYGLTTGYGSEATSTYSGGLGAFSKAISGLVASTLYHFRSKSYNSAGWGYGSDATLTTSAPFAATGGTITYSGGYKIHTFTTNGTFTVTGSGNNVEVLIVAGGGSSGGNNSGGGGAGGLIHYSSYSVSPGAYTVTIGAGGTGWSPGGNTVFGSETAIGGGTSAGNGGSGGGGPNNPPNAGGSGTSGQGHNGGNGVYEWDNPCGGGGGAGAAGQTPASPQSPGGNGGVGLAFDISGTMTYYAGGGGGASLGVGGTGGLGGGGNGRGGAGAGTPGTPNTGGGAGSSGYPGGASTAGGSGIVIVRYLQ